MAGYPKHALKEVYLVNIISIRSRLDRRRGGQGERAGWPAGKRRTGRSGALATRRV